MKQHSFLIDSSLLKVCKVFRSLERRTMSELASGCFRELHLQLQPFLVNGHPEEPEQTLVEKTRTLQIARSAVTAWTKTARTSLQPRRKGSCKCATVSGCVQHAQAFSHPCSNCAVSKLCWTRVCCKLFKRSSSRFDFCTFMSLAIVCCPICRTSAELIPGYV